MYTVVVVYLQDVTAIHHGPVVSMDTSVRMHTTSHLEYGLIVVYLIVR